VVTPGAGTVAAVSEGVVALETVAVARSSGVTNCLAMPSRGSSGG
jgi:hypothetical protein